ncbi:hypothetical protein M5C99_01055 [Acidovorax sp. NCPPB 2350]|nr:hypothetical protein M5C99_01055 [Acidovorax sp. NCPPB 2350]
MPLNPLIRTGLIAAALAAAGAHAQPQPPGPLGPGGPVATPAPVAQATQSGRLQRWLLNPNGEADGLLLDDGTQVAFPPHLSTSLTSWLRPGDAVDVVGWRISSTAAMRASTIRSQGRSVDDTPPVPGQFPPPPRDALSAMNTDGRIALVLFNDRGDAHGVLLDNGVIVRFPPHVGFAQAALLQPGVTFSARGWGTRNTLGIALEAAQMGATADTLQDVLGPIGPAGPVGPAGGPPRAP